MLYKHIYPLLFGGIFAVTFSLESTGAIAANCAPRNAPAPADALRRLYAAAMRIDREAFIVELAPEFYAFDGGKRYSREQFGDLPQALHDKGETYIWNVTEPDTHISCNTAWVAYVNRGSFKDRSGTESALWLESANLVWLNGTWKILFFQSTFVKPQLPR